MKLAEITKKDFLDSLKDPHKALIRRKIKDLRKAIKPGRWKVYYRFDKTSRVFKLSIFRDSYAYDIFGKPTNEGHDLVHETLSTIFPEPQFEIESWEGPSIGEITAVIFDNKRQVDVLN